MSGDMSIDCIVELLEENLSKIPDKPHNNKKLYDFLKGDNCNESKDVVNSFSQLGIIIKSEDGKYKKMIDVLKELSELWNTKIRNVDK